MQLNWVDGLGSCIPAPPTPHPGSDAATDGPPWIRRPVPFSRGVRSKCTAFRRRGHTPRDTRPPSSHRVVSPPYEPSVPHLSAPLPPPDTDLSLAPQFRLFQNVPQLEPDGPLSGARAQGAPAPSQGWPARFFHLPRTSRLLPSFGNHVRGRHTHLWTGFRVDTFSAPRVNIIGARDCWVTP